jgi:hypothetical protein
VLATWTDAFLDSMRLRGDVHADFVVDSLFKEHDIGAVQPVIDRLVRNGDVPSDQLPPVVRDYFASTDHVAIPDPGAVRAGQELFASYGPEIAMLLACCSLPVAYYAPKGVQVLYRTGYLAQRPLRRVAQTSQMVIDVMTPGGLEPGGRGRRTAQKVRLMHAAIRYRILHFPDVEHPWPHACGIPINQEDLAGTLGTFTVAILRGLEKLHIDLTPEQAQSYLEAWKAVARILGIVDDLIPATVPDANALADRIFSRQKGLSDEGRLLNDALLGTLKDRILPPFKGLVDALCRHLLPAEVADGFGIPEQHLDEYLVKTGIDFGHLLDVVTGGPARRALFREFSLQVLEVMTFIEAGGRRTRFHIPVHLHDSAELAEQ